MVAAASATEQPAYRVEAGDVVADRERILALWQACGFGGDAAENAARYDCTYLHNPQGRGRIYLLRAPGSDELAGSAGVGARMFHSGGKSDLLPSGTLVDFVVHPAHRSLYPALLLQRTVCELEFRNCGFLYGLPVEKAVPVVRRLAGAVRFSSGTYVRVIRSARYLRKKLGWLPMPLANALAKGVDVLRATWVILGVGSARVRCHSHDEQPPDLESCLRKITEEENVTIGDRGREILAWRAHSADRNFEAVSFQDSRSNQTIGYAMYALTSGDLVVLDFIVPRENRQARGIWLALCRRAAALGAAVVRVEFGGCERVTAQLRSAGYVQRGSRPGYVIMREESTGAWTGNWWFTRFDEDV